MTDLTPQLWESEERPPETRIFSKAWNYLVKPALYTACAITFVPFFFSTIYHAISRNAGVFYLKIFIISSMIYHPLIKLAEFAQRILPTTSARRNSGEINQARARGSEPSPNSITTELRMSLDNADEFHASEIESEEEEYDVARDTSSMSDIGVDTAF
jgi:hypothetical protein